MCIGSFGWQFGVDDTITWKNYGQNVWRFIMFWLFIMLTNLLSVFMLDSEALADFEITYSDETFSVAAFSFQCAEDIFLNFCTKFRL